MPNVLRKKVRGLYYYFGKTLLWMESLLSHLLYIIFVDLDLLFKKVQDNVGDQEI